jgi:molecular chaperone GrpE (heat shock protein)
MGLKGVISSIKSKRKEEKKAEEEVSPEYIREVVDAVVEGKLSELEEIIREAASREAAVALKEQMGLVGMQFIKLGDLMREVISSLGEVLQSLGKGVDLAAVERLREVYTAGIRVVGEIGMELEGLQQQLESLREAREWIENSGKAVIDLKAEIGRVNSELKRMQAEYNDLRERLKRDLLDSVSERVLADMLRYGITDRIKEDVVNTAIVRLSAMGWEAIKSDVEKKLGEFFNAKKEELKEEILRELAK